MHTLSSTEVRCPSEDPPQMTTGIIVWAMQMQKLMFTGRMLVSLVTIVVIFLLGNLGWPNSLLLQEIRDGGCHLVAKQPKGDNVPEDENGIFWRFSFSAAEKKLFLLGGHGEASSCRKHVLRILKALREELHLHPLTSYHLKTILLHECEAYPHPNQWSYDSLSERFLSFLQRLEDCLRQFNCPHYFMTHLNLFEFFGRQRCDELAKKVKEIILHPEEVLINLIK